MNNHLFYGDNMQIMQQELLDKGLQVDLIYLDPPFNSHRDYSTIYKDETGNPLPAQVRAFTDTWEWSAQHQAKLDQFPRLIDEPSPLMGLIPALSYTQPRMAAYLVYMAERLALMRQLLKDSGTIYLHCDPNASHYLKVVMDCVFGSANFRNEIVWYYRGAGVPRKDFARRHDIIFRYAPNENLLFFDPDPARQPYAEATEKRFSHYVGNVRGDRDYGEQQLNPGGKHPDDVITDIQPIAPSAKERLGYPTQKPLTLLKRIIEVSSNPGDVVLDPFCGCGTAMEAAHHLDRYWIGIDITIHAVRRVSRRRLQERCGLALGRDYEISGIPNSVESASDLHRHDPYAYQVWAVEEVGGFPTRKKTADGGVDGRIWYHQPGTKDYGVMALEVKGGRPKITDLRALIGVLGQDPKLTLAGLIVHELPPRMRQNWNVELGKLDLITVGGEQYAPVQILTVAEILNGKRFHTPTRAASENDKITERML